MLHRLGKHPEITILRRELDRFDKNNSWPVDHDLELSETVKFKGITLILTIDPDESMSYFNFDSVASVDKQVRELQEEGGNPEDYCVKISLRFPNVKIPVKKTSRRWNYHTSTYKNEPFFDDKYIPIEVKGTTTFEKLLVDLEAAHKTYLGNITLKKQGEAKKTEFEAAQKRIEEAAKAAAEAAAKAKKPANVDKVIVAKRK